MKPLISVIVPIYKVEKYLERCINSIVNQTYSNLEIILVDDGSPDQCPKICDEWATKDTRIRVIHKENGGLSDARNYGVKKCTGQFVYFLDSDDWIHEKTLEILLYKLLENQGDLIACNFKKVNSQQEENVSAKYDNVPVMTFTAEEGMQCLINDNYIKTVVWNKLYKIESIVDVSFEEGKYNEDEYFTYQIVGKCKKIIYVNIPLYYYYQRSDSIMGKYTLKHLDALEGMYRRLKYIDKNYSKLSFNAKKSFLCSLIMHCKEIIYLSEIESKDIQNAIDKLKCYRKNIKFSFAEFLQCNVKMKVYILGSHFSITGLCKLLTQKKR